MKFTNSKSWMTAGLVVAMGLSACAPSRVALKKDFWTDKNPSIVVALASYPKAGAHKEGAQGLVDYAINSAMASSLDKYLSKLEVAGFTDEREHFVNELKARGFNARAVQDPLDFSSKDAKKE